MDNPVHNVEIDDDEVVEVEGGTWARVEDLFINLVVEEVKNGNRKTTTLTKPAWNRIRDELKKNGRDFTQDQLKNKYNSLRQRWKDFSGLLKETGMSYINETGQLTASKETWNNLYKKYKTAKRFRKKGCKEYPKLSSIFGDTTATGSHAHPSTKSPSLSESDCEEDTSDDGRDSRKKKKIKLGGASRGASRGARRQAREDLHSAMAHAFTAIGENSKRKLEILEKKVGGGSIAFAEDIGEGVGPQRSIDGTVEKCIKELEVLEGIDAASYVKAVEALHSSHVYRTMFLVMSDTRKKDWVLNLGH